jgi:diaminopropionate ammonia-lyase
MGEEVRLVVNSRAAPRGASYGPLQDRVLSAAGFAAARTEIAGWPGYAPTPLVSLPARARALGLGGIHYKDESGRFGLGSFKALGGAYAVARVLVRSLEARGIPGQITTADLASGRYRGITERITVASATDGNHGRAVAWGARLLGCRAVIFIHATVSDERRAAIASYGADVVRVSGGYDESVRHAFAAAAANGWSVVQDTAAGAYREVPADITYGYGVLAGEIVAAMSEPPTHVLVPAGVGGLASAVAAVFWQAWGWRRPTFVVIEPLTADCVTRSIAAGRQVEIAGDTDTFMAGLACGVVSDLAWEILKDGADAALAIDDDFARAGMRALAGPVGGDPAIVGGECAGGVIGALIALADRSDLRAALGFGPASHVVVIGTEGATDPAIYRAVVGRSAEAVRGDS